MRRLLFWSLIVLLCSGRANARPSSEEPAESAERILSLLDGAIYRGELIEYVPHSHVVMKLASGQVRRFEWNQVKRVALVASSNSAIAVPPAKVENRQPPRPVAPALPTPPVTTEPRSAPVPAPQLSARPPADLEAAYQAHAGRAKDLYEDDDLPGALEEYKAAYRIIPRPTVLFSMARINQRLGRLDEALHQFQRFLREDQNVSPERRVQVKGFIADIAMKQPAQTTAPAPYSPPEEARLESAAQEQSGGDVYKRNIGLMATGISIFASSYLAALVVGGLGLAAADLVQSNSAATANSVRVASGTLLIPVAGPLISAISAPSINWSIPWVLAGMGTQVAGMVMTIAGAQKHRVTPAPNPDVALVPFGGPTGSGIAVIGRF